MDIDKRGENVERRGAEVISQCLPMISQQILTKSASSSMTR